LYFIRERSKRLSIRTLPFLERFLKAPGRHADQQHSRLSANVLESVCRPSRDENYGLSGRVHNAVTELDLKVPTDDVEELILGLVDVRGWPALRRDGLTKQAYRSAGLLAG
jgi:hypothetical protein